MQRPTLTHVSGSYQIIEQSVVARTSDAPSEDMIGDLGSFLVVVDGVTGKDRARFHGLTGGRFAAETVLSAVNDLPADADARTAVDHVSDALHAAIEAAGGPRLHPPGTQLAMYSAARQEIWRVGDIHARIGTLVQATHTPPTDKVATEFRAAYLSALLAAGYDAGELAANDPSWEAMLPLLAQQDVFANQTKHHPYGYGVINGTPVPDHHLHVRHVPAGSEVVLATDGYLSVEGTLVDAETELAYVTSRDPLLIRLHKGFRPANDRGSFDDRAWVRFLTR